MSSALWLIYFGGVVQSVGGFSVVIAVAFTLGYAIWRLVTLIDDDIESKPPLWMLKSAAACAVLTCILPSKTVLYTAAAVNVGQAVAETETGRLAITALNRWLQDQIGPQQPNEARR